VFSSDDARNFHLGRAIAQRGLGDGSPPVRSMGESTGPVGEQLKQFADIVYKQMFTAETINL